ncbi:hypothetical protein EVB94_173 [Rhizobium phage RHph_TM40]|uniref:Uncharacterized protein n=1 Tax=Rhizobium phage RHph_Y65 TaxID=2509785 RepID=A0A7S5R7V0_9CAUD|nr:hypothetical protein PQC17_gp174 [Rhizobium phage RHph_Y65]QIG71644.1 hypothetical protein EVB94_173 [Rhizobium phage RHph_TM40]QIG72732.1 hypothetical protein EVB97_174 [Rhizobium phage RHph_Y65]QIG77497.1 hypothetical protein EVB61_169 [Rhizobium phage RHph_TM21B]QIG77759.1 hypothetical protein EVB64_172 [Rhizobium phage RHph_TM61]
MRDYNLRYDQDALVSVKLKKGNDRRDRNSRSLKELTGKIKLVIPSGADEYTYLRYKGLVKRPRRNTKSLKSAPKTSIRYAIVTRNGNTICNHTRLRSTKEETERRKRIRELANRAREMFDDMDCDVFADNVWKLLNGDESGKMYFGVNEQ